MEHVSTLCAVSTVGIAATGFALGRVEQTQSLERTRIQHAPLLVSNTTPSSAARPSETFATPQLLSPTAADFSETQENAALCTEHAGNSNAPPRKTSFAGVRLRRRGQTLTIPPVRSEENPPASSHGRRPSSSWIRRLSFQPEKRFSLQSPDSLSFPEPASPTPSRLSSQRRTPNKLVKRPKSNHSNGKPLFAHAVSSPLIPSGLRRPATSYQRSETFKHRPTHSLSFEPSLALSPLVEPSSGNPPPKIEPWQPFITASSDAPPERLDRRFSTSTKPKEQAVRRILPQSDVSPALLLATSIIKKEVASEALSKPPAVTPPVEFRNPFVADDPPQQVEAHPTEAEKQTFNPSSEETCPKSPTEVPAPLDVRVFRNGSFTGPKRRAVSTPLPNLANVEGAIWMSSPRAPGRRNITDPSVFRRPSTTSNGRLPALFTSGIMGSQSKVLSPYHKECTNDLGQHRYRDNGHRGSTDGSALSSLYDSVRRRPKRHSIAASDPASTVMGSDDTRVFTSGDEDETDFMSDTAFDSIRTHITTDSTCFQSPRIETIFDRTLPSGTNDGLPTGSNGIVSANSVIPPENRHLDSIVGQNAGEEAPGVSILTPAAQNLVDTPEGDSEILFPSDLSDDDDSRSIIASLPGDKTIRTSLALAKFDVLAPDNTSDQDCGQCTSITQGIMGNHIPLRETVEHGLNGVTEEAHDTSLRMNIFDWSEQSKPDREGTGPDGRPRTVHGKHGPGMRGSRASGRKQPSTLHYRSQSVPVAREPMVSSEPRQPSGKFGTWGLGSKGVSEDWDSDFEFEFEDRDKDKDESSLNGNTNPRNNASQRNVIVPQAIMERQASLHGQFGQVQELTLLVEELKRLRHQASFLDIVRGPSNELWKEAEGIVDLATIDDDDNNQPPPRSPSLTFSFDESEGESSQSNDPWKRVSGDSWRVSISENPGTRPTTSPCPEKTVPSNKANSVLDLIYQQRLSHDPTNSSQFPRSKKLPFDTQSLRDLVVRAGVVTRALKEVVRKAEGVPNGFEENTRPSHPPFSRIFENHSHDGFSKFETSCIS